MGRHLRGNIPLLNSQLTPEWKYLDGFRSNNRGFKDRQKRDYDRHHGARTLPPIPDDVEVWITSGDQPATGTVVLPASTPRSYVVETPTGQVRRNRQHLDVVPGRPESIDRTRPPTPEPIMT